MGKVTGFLEFEREDRHYQPVAERIKHWHEFVLPLPDKEVRDQAARCMDCGEPHQRRPHRLPGQQPDSRLERPRLSQSLGRSGAQSAFDQ
jgi:hypothetical protein